MFVDQLLKLADLKKEQLIPIDSFALFSAKGFEKSVNLMLFGCEHCPRISHDIDLPKNIPLFVSSKILKHKTSVNMLFTGRYVFSAMPRAYSLKPITLQSKFIELDVIPNRSAAFPKVMKGRFESPLGFDELIQLKAGSRFALKW